jgi:hypothetical protein
LNAALLLDSKAAHLQEFRLFATRNDDGSFTGTIHALNISAKAPRAGRASPHARCQPSTVAAALSFTSASEADTSKRAPERLADASKNHVGISII